MGVSLVTRASPIPVRPAWKLPTTAFSAPRAHPCEYGEPRWPTLDDLDLGLYLSIPFFSFVTSGQGVGIALKIRRSLAEEAAKRERKGKRPDPSLKTGEGKPGKSAEQAAKQAAKQKRNYFVSELSGNFPEGTVMVTVDAGRLPPGKTEDSSDLRTTPTVGLPLPLPEGKYRILYADPPHKDFLPSEAVAIAEAVEPKEEKKAKDRQRLSSGRGKKVGKVTTPFQGRTRGKVARYTGMSGAYVSSLSLTGLGGKQICAALG